MDDKSLRKLIDDYLKDAKVMQFATSVDGQPWICTVNYIPDLNWNLYWMSMRTRRHSVELKSNSKASVAIVKDPNIKRGLQMEGLAYELEKDELVKAHQLYGERYGQKDERLKEAQSNEPNIRTYYVFRPSAIVLFDEVNFPDNPRQELSLNS